MTILNEYAEWEYVEAHIRLEASVSPDPDHPRGTITATAMFSADGLQYSRMASTDSSTIIYEEYDLDDTSGLVDDLAYVYRQYSVANPSSQYANFSSYRMEYAAGGTTASDERFYVFMSRSTGVHVHEIDVLVPESIEHTCDTYRDYDATFVRGSGPADFNAEVAAWPLRAPSEMTASVPQERLPEWTDPEFDDIQDWY